MTQRYLVTGGCGFVGSALCHRLVHNGAELVVLDNLSSGSVSRLPGSANFVRGDICDREAVREALVGVDGVFHLAAIASVQQCANNRAEATRTNLHGTGTVVEAAGDLPVVFTSSAAVYGDQKTMPVSESAAPAPISSYAEDKLGSEQHLRDAAERRGARGLAVRPFNIFGPGQPGASPYSGVLSRFVELARAGKPLQVNGDGGQTRDFIHVDEIAKALQAGMEFSRQSRAGTFEVVNLCSGQAISILELARLVNTLSGSQVPISFGSARAGDIRHSTGDPAKARDLLGFAPEMSIADGVAAMVRRPEEPARVLRSVIR